MRTLFGRALLAAATACAGLAAVAPAPALAMPVDPPEVVVAVDETSRVMNEKVKFTYTLKNLTEVTEFSHQYPVGMTGAAQVVAETTCPVAVFPTAATATAGSKVRVLFNSVPSTDCKVVVNATASKRGSFDLSEGFTSTTLGTRGEWVCPDPGPGPGPGPGAGEILACDEPTFEGDYAYSAEGTTVIVHDPALPTVTTTVTSDPESATNITSDLLGNVQLLTYTVTGVPYGVENNYSFTHSLPDGLAFHTPTDSGGPFILTPCSYDDDYAIDDDGMLSLNDGRLDNNDTDTAKSCTVSVWVKPAQAGPFNYASGFVVGKDDDDLNTLAGAPAARNVYIADPTIPTVTLSLDKSRVTLGDDVIFDYKVTGMPYGTDHVDFSFADSSLSNVNQNYFSSQGVVSNTCGGVAQGYGVTGATLNAVTTATAPECHLKVKWRALGAGHFEFGSDMILLGLTNGIDPVVELDVDPTVTMEVDEVDVVRGDDLTVTYTVDGGNAKGDNDWSWSHEYLPAFDYATVVSNSCSSSDGPPVGEIVIGNAGIDEGVASANLSGDTTDLMDNDGSCTFVVTVRTGTPGHHDLAAGITTEGVTNRVTETSIFIADPTLPSYTISTDKSVIAIGEKVNVTFDVTGVAYGTPHDEFFIGLSNPLFWRGMFDVTMTSNTCGGVLYLNDPTVQTYDHSLPGTEETTPMTCRVNLEMVANGVGMLDLARGITGLNDLPYVDTGWKTITVLPTLTASVGSTSYRVGDEFNITYKVAGGTFTNPSSPWDPMSFVGSSAPGGYTYRHELPANLSFESVVNSSCGNEHTHTASTLTVNQNMSAWSVSSAPKCELTMRVKALTPGKFDALQRITMSGFTLGAYLEDDGHAAPTAGLTNSVVPSVIYVADTTKPTVTMTASSANITTGDDVTLTYAVAGLPFGAAHPNSTVNHALPTGIGTVRPGTNTCGGSLSATGTAVALTGVPFPGTETSTAPSCSFSVILKTAKAGNYSVGSGVTTSMTTGVAATPVVIADPAGFVAVNPARVLDTRTGQTSPTGSNLAAAPVTAGSVTEVVIAGVSGVPATATDVVLNVIAVDPSAAGYLTVYPCGSTRPQTSNVNFTPGQTRSNGVSVKLGTGGKVCIYSSAATHLVVDVNGAQVPHAGDGFATLAPTRALDTRSGQRINANETYRLALAGRHGVPANASAAVLNVTSTGAQATGYLTVFPCGTSMPLASSLNFTAGNDIANSVVSKIGSTGEVCIFASAPTHVIVDANGAFSPSGQNRSWQFDPSRLLDTRSSVKPAAGSVTEVTVAGRQGVPANATAVVLNVTAVDPNSAGYITVFPCGSTMPIVSNLNYSSGQVVPNAATVSVGANGKVCIFTTSAAHLVVDLNGSFAPR